MDELLMKTMLEVDEHHWWYRGRRRIIRAELERLALPPDASVLDAGCGSGRTMEDLVEYGRVYGVEVDPDATEIARARGVGEVREGRIEELPFDDAMFDLITCLDVLEHVPDDRAALVELRRVCQPGGWLLATVPAYPGLWSLHDRINHHYRRYEQGTLRAAAVDAGWLVRRVTYFFSFLLPPAAIVRLAQRRRAEDDYKPDLTIGPPWLNTILEQLLRIEASWLGRGATLPAGLSLLAVLQDPGG
jgi:ubiquinone/menaquinone biosynthesis C-methylase UbiE